MGPMPPEDINVQLYGTLADIAGVSEVTVEASTLRDVYVVLSRKFPEMAEHLNGNVSVSIDGRIYTEALFEPVSARNEVVILPRIAGG